MTTAATDSILGDGYEVVSRINLPLRTTKEVTINNKTGRNILLNYYNHASKMTIDFLNDRSNRTSRDQARAERNDRSSSSTNVSSEVGMAAGPTVKAAVAKANSEDHETNNEKDRQRGSERN